MSRPRTTVTAALGLLVAVLGTALLALVGVAGPAAAHDGGGAAFTGEAGPYTLYAYDGVPGSAPGTLDYSVILLRTADGAPVDGATLDVSAEPADGSGATAQSVRAQSVANVYEVTLSDPGAGTWRARLTVDGPDGPGSTEATLHGAGTAASAPTGTSVWLVAAGGAVAALGVAAVTAARRRRSEVTA